MGWTSPPSPPQPLSSKTIQIRAALIGSMALARVYSHGSASSSEARSAGPMDTAFPCGFSALD